MQLDRVAHRGEGGSSCDGNFVSIAPFEPI